MNQAKHKRPNKMLHQKKKKNPLERGAYNAKQNNNNNYNNNKNTPPKKH